jgi:hypothetical protein
VDTSFAGNCPGNLRTTSKKNVNAVINCLNAENAARVQENAGLISQLNSLKAQISDLSSLRTQIETLQQDVSYLKGLPPVIPIGTYENDFMKVTVLGLRKLVSSSTGQASFTGTFQVQNKTASPLYVGWDRISGFAVTDNAGNTASCSGLSGAGCSPAGIAGLRDDAPSASRSNFSMLAANSILTFGLTTNSLTTDVSAKLGTRFNLTFELVRYINPDLVSGAFDTHVVGFAGIAPTP